MRVHECGKLEGKKKGNESANCIIVNHAAAPQKLKIASIAYKIIPGHKGVRIEPGQRKPFSKESKKPITGSGKRNKESTESDNEDNPGRKDPGRVDRGQTGPSDYGGSLKKPGYIVIDHK